jgi:ArsR family transcriptional regulator, arsenate/arsenite/antimonite-responsive transcriptional repressor
MKKTAVIEALGALAQETRLDIFRLLVAAGEDGIAAGRIGDQLDLPAPTLSFHLNQLRHAGLVVPRREGRSIIYAADYAAMNGLLGFLTENCCRGDESRFVRAAAARQPSRASRVGVAAACAAETDPCGVAVCEPATATMKPARRVRQ